MYKELVNRFSEYLHLQHKPIGLAFVEQVPENVQHMAKRVPSACTFWRLGEQGVFYADANDHLQCPIGMMTMGFTMPQEAQERAQGLVQTMANVQYFSPAEVSVLPIVDKPHQSIVYGALEQFPLEPDIILCIITAQQAMLLAEAQGQVNWLQAGQSAFGRPTCGVIPRTMKIGEVSMSFGCVGARTYVELEPGELVVTLPARIFVEIVEHLQVTSDANEALAPYHQQQKATFGV